MLSLICKILVSVVFVLIFKPVGWAQATLPIDNWAIRDAVNTVVISPDGKHVLLMRILSKEGENLLEIYDVNNFSKPKRRLNAKPMEFLNARWVSDNVIAGTAWKVVRKKVKGPEEDVRSYKLYAYDVKKNKFSEAEGSFSIVGLLPKKPNHILISTGNTTGNGLGVDPFEFARPRSYYKYDLRTGAKSLVLKGNDKYFNVQFDIDGHPRSAQSQNLDKNTIINYYRLPGDKNWKPMGKVVDLDSHENLYRVLSGIHGFVGFDSRDPAIGYLIENKIDDKLANTTGLWELNFNTGRHQLLYQNPSADVVGVLRHSNFWGGRNDIVAAIYPGLRYERHWFDAQEQALYAGLEQAIPQAHQITITSRSRAGNAMIVSNTGPRDPGSFWLFKDGMLTKIASRNPLVSPEDLSDVEFITYKARDGLPIPAYVTRPKGEGPFPLIVLPHGGPHVNEVIGYDEWGQLLANNGYMVLQPQYRMSVGWGQKHFDLAMGEHGLAMQDDKDDGALYLIEKGEVDKDRVAMFGWSYGGYAALVAASRDPNIYQCVIAGAAVANPRKVYLLRKGRNTPKAIDEWAKARGGYVGVNPMEEIDEVNVPVLMVHGDVDRRVLYFNFKEYKQSLQKAGKLGDYLTLQGADHFSLTLMYAHQRDFYTKMLDYLKNNCGPKGL